MQKNRCEKRDAGAFIIVQGFKVFGCGLTDPAANHAASEIRNGTFPNGLTADSFQEIDLLNL